MIEYIATKINLRTYAHEAYFLFDIDCGEDFNYRGRVSSNAFFHGQRNKKSRTSTHLFYGRQFNSIEQNNMNDYIADFGSVPVTKLKSIWKFYEAVGYDYRKKRWING